MKSSAVLLITFNRPENTKIVFNKIVSSGVKKLYVFNDGPRDNNTEDLKARNDIADMLKQYKGDCDIKTLFSKSNYGCGPGPVKAITWAFEKEDRLIILEDDCVASRSFFCYCYFVLLSFMILCSSLVLTFLLSILFFLPNCSSVLLPLLILQAILFLSLLPP